MDDATPAGRGWKVAGVVAVLASLLTVLPGAGLLVVFMSAAAPPAAAAPASVPGLNATVLSAYTHAIQVLPSLRPQCHGLTWSVLAGIGAVESNNADGRTVTADGTVTPPIHGPALDGSGTGGNTTPIRGADGGYARAEGPMQFMPATWAGVGQDGNGDGVKDPQNIFDAALTAAVYLCGTGPVDLSDTAALRAAILRYNHSTSYVDDVLSRAVTFASYTAATSTLPQTGTGSAIVAAARSYIGIPYVWGGGRPAPGAGPDAPPFGPTARPDITHDPKHPNLVGFDCSGMTRAAVYKATGQTIPALASAQAYVGTYIPPSAGLGAVQPGDLVFFATNPADRSTIYHVGIYAGGGQMIAAPQTGENVKQQAVWTHGYAGAAHL